VITLNDFMDPIILPHHTPRKEWDTPAKAKIRGIYQAAAISQRGLEAATGMPQSTVSRTLNFTTERRHRAGRTGRPPKIPPDKVKEILRAMEGHYLERAKEWNEIARDWDLHADKQTVRRAFKKEGYYKCKACKKGFHSPENRQKRLNFAQEHVAWSLDDWQKVVFSDEAHFLTGKKNAEYVIRTKGERYHDDCIQWNSKHSMVMFSCWAMIGWNYKGPLVFYQKKDFCIDFYLEHILKPHVGPQWQAWREEGINGMIYQEDGDSKHGNNSNNECKFWKIQNLRNLLLPWPPYSPDFSPIENIWRLLKTRINRRKPLTKDELEAAIKAEWELLTLEEINGYFTSMPRRMISALEREGRATEY
jgi:transposase